MAGDLTFKSFLKDLGLRIGAAAVVVGIFFGLGYLNRTDLFGFSSVLGTQFGFFGSAFLLVGIASVLWILFQRTKGSQ